MNIGGGEAADQMVRMILSGGEVAVRLTGSAAKNLLAISLALAKSHKKVSGRMRMGKMLQQTRNLRTFPMTQEEYRAFKKGAQEKKLLYAAIKDTRTPNGMVDVVMPPSEVERANLVFAQMMYRQPEAERQKAQEVPAKEKQPETPKKDSRSGRGSRDTSISSPTHAESAARTTDERPSVEGRLKAYRAQLDGQRRSAPARQKAKSRKRAKAK
ncbi:MAG: PcfB family protein [Clostridiaceae bacterium]|nr:PcfB family protein [Clostridiaceae bacterium]